VKGGSAAINAISSSYSGYDITTGKVQLSNMAIGYVPMFFAYLFGKIASRVLKWENLLDLHSSYDATGSTDTVVDESAANAVIPANDGATTKGISPFAGAVMLAFGAHVVAAAQALVAIGLKSNNIPDPTNQLSEAYNSTPTVTSILKSYFCSLGYLKGPNLVTYANEAAGKTATFKMDWISGVGATHPGTFIPPAPAIYTVIFSGALTAGAYGTQAFAPTTTPPLGQYAILGAKATSLTTAALLRFQHTDFQGALPGFPVLDYATGTLTGANQGGNILASDSWQGYQFVYLSQLFGVACCPVFTVQGQGTGLNIQCLDTAADTPQIVLNLLKVA
jgi:hypothetical protein